MTMVKTIWIQICSNIFCIIFMWNHRIPELKFGIIIRFGIGITIRVWVRVADLDILCIFLSLFFHEILNFFIKAAGHFLSSSLFVLFNLPFLSITSMTCSFSTILIYNVHCILDSILEGFWFLVVCGLFLTSELQINIILWNKIFQIILLNLILCNSRLSRSSIKLNLHFCGCIRNVFGIIFTVLN